MKTVVTTAHNPDPATREAAERLAAELGMPLVSRGPMAGLLEGQEGVWVVERGRLSLYLPELDQPVRFHGALGVPRLRHVLSGGEDALCRHAGLRPGDVVVDATCGQGADTLAVAATLGETGRVIGLEGSEALYRLLADGLARTHDDPGIEAVRGRIELVHTDHATWLAARPDDSVDVVIFDPMYADPAGAGPSFAGLRRLASPARLTPDILDDAQRIARRRVVLAARPGDEGPAAWGLERVSPPRARRAIWVVSPSDR